MHRRLLLAMPDLHGAEALSHLPHGPCPSPERTVAVPLPVDVAVPRHPRSSRREGVSPVHYGNGSREGLSFLSRAPRRFPVVHRTLWVRRVVTPIYGPMVLICVVGGTRSGPKIERRILEPDLDLALGWVPVGRHGLSPGPGLKARASLRRSHSSCPAWLRTNASTFRLS